MASLNEIYGSAYTRSKSGDVTYHDVILTQPWKHKLRAVNVSGTIFLIQFGYDAAASKLANTDVFNMQGTTIGKFPKSAGWTIKEIIQSHT